MPDTTTDGRHRSILRRIARRAMQERGLLPDFSPAALAELEAIGEPARFADAGTCDLRDLIWCSIDNDDSRDLDQLTVAQLLRAQRAPLVRNQGAVLSPALRVGRFFVGSSGVVYRWWCPASYLLAYTLPTLRLTSSFARNTTATADRGSFGFQCFEDFPSGSLELLNTRWSCEP